MVRTKQGEFSWVDLAAKDLDAQTAFYESLFGWSHVDVPTDVGPIYRMFMLGDARIAGGSQMTPEAYPPGTPTMWNTYIYAEDVDAVAKRTEELGGSVLMPPMDVMKEGRMVGITDPTGAAVFFWQPGAHGGAEMFNQPGAIMWNELSTRDMVGAQRFYNALLGWRIDRLDSGPMPYWQIVVDGQPEGGMMPMPATMPQSVPPNWLVYFGVEDVGAAVERAKAAGGTVVAEPMNAPGMRFAVLGDPEGAVFSVMQMTS